MLSECKPLMKEYVSLKFKTGYRTGGNAKLFFEPESLKELKKGLFYFYQHDIPVFVLGGGNNVLISDSGLDGAVIHLKGVFTEIFLEDDMIVCGTGVTNAAFCKFCVSHELEGYEFLAGFPGTVGGDIAGNAGMGGYSICDYVEEVRSITFKGEEEALGKEELQYNYRNSFFSKNKVMTQVMLKSFKGQKGTIRKKMEDIRCKRKYTDPKGFSCGSVFKNPVGKMAWEVIDALKLRGYRRGNIEVSAKHPNWILNHGGASSQEIWNCINMIQALSLKELKIALELEINLWGDFSGGSLIC